MRVREKICIGLTIYAVCLLGLYMWEGTKAVMMVGVIIPCLLAFGLGEMVYRPTEESTDDADE